jgi:hypothetical protein
MDAPIHNSNVRYSSYTPAQKRATQKYRVNNKDKVNEQRKKYYETRKENDPEFLAYKRQKAKEYYQRKKEEEALPEAPEATEPVAPIVTPEEYKSSREEEIVSKPKVKRVYKKKVKVEIPQVPVIVDTPPPIPEPDIIDTPLELVEVKPKKPMGKKMFIPPKPPKE